MLPLAAVPRRVLMTADAVGGVWTHALDLAHGLAEHGVRTVLAVLGPAPRAAPSVPGLVVRKTGLPLDWTAESPAELAAAGAEIAAMAAAEGVDLVHLNSPALAARTRFDRPVVGACHSCVATWWHAVRGEGVPMPDDFAWRGDLVAEGCAAVDALVAPSAAFARATTEAYRLRRAPIVVHNGRRPAEDTGAGSGPPVDAVFTAGRLWDEGKNLAALDRAAGRLAVPVRAAGPLAGPNGAAIALRHIQPLGTLDAAAVAAWLARHPVFASLARYEPFGLAVLEAAQAGCALVLSDIPTFRELWDGAAVFVPPGSSDLATAAAIDGLLRDRMRRQAIGAAAQDRARRHTVAAMTDGMLRIYAEAMAAPRRQGRAA